MAYSTQSDVQTAVGGAARLLQYSDQEGDGAINAAVVAKAIAEADGVIDSMIGHRYAVPLAVVPDTIKALSARWAARVLRVNNYQGAPITEDLDREKIDREWLEMVAAGTVSLGIEPTPAKASIVIDKAAQRSSRALVSRLRTRGAW